GEHLSFLQVRPLHGRIVLPILKKVALRRSLPRPSALSISASVQDRYKSSPFGVPEDNHHSHLIEQRFGTGFKDPGVREAVMAKRKKTTGKTKPKRKKTRAKASTRKEDNDGQNNQANRQKDSEEGSASGSVTSESQADPGEANGSQADAKPAAATCSGGAACRHRDPLLQPSVSRHSAARAWCYVAYWRWDPPHRAHHRF